jgi:NADH-quinone oxidoreductase subunit G
VGVTIDGVEVQAPRGELLIKVAQQHGTYIPRFCWHERMKPVGMCRMCLVEVEGMRGLQISCATPVTDGMVVRTQSAAVKTVQDGVLELLLVNHPLDCPVCDRGGECPLQDQTLAFGPGESRFVEEKRHFEKPVAISDLVLLDRERCIQCGRCTRFAAEIAGDALIDFGGRGDSTEVITYPDEPFTSYFSGNTVQICPVGALTASSYRFRARPWDLQTVETSCQTCAVGCRGALQSTSNRVVRFLGVDSEPVNQGWLCDKGRYGIEWVHGDERVGVPMCRDDTGSLVETGWPEALDDAANALRQTLDTHGPGAVAVIGGARGTNEDAYAWARLAKGVLGTDHVDAQLGDGLPADVLLGLRDSRRSAGARSRVRSSDWPERSA